MTGHETRTALSEEWFPITELGIESRRERAAVHALPPLSFLHVWWARRPLVASAALVIAGLMPAWSDDVERWLSAYFDELTQGDRANLLGVRPSVRPQRRHLAPSEEWYGDWLLHLVGIWGDPVAGRLAIDQSDSVGIRLKGDPFGYKQAYRNSVDRTHVEALQSLLIYSWGELPTLLDSTAGGGAIPFEATRYGIPVIANDLNGVAAAILEAGVKAPAVVGSGIEADLAKWGQTLVGRIEARLLPYFPQEPTESIVAYLWTRAVRDPRCGRLVPLMPDFWLCSQPGKEVAVELVVDGIAGTEALDFRLLTGANVDRARAQRGTITRGTAVSPYDNLVIDSDYIKAEAQAGRMQDVLYAVAVKDARNNRVFRVPRAEEVRAIESAAADLERVRATWVASDLLPSEEIPQGLKTAEPLRFGMTRWADMFNPRQLLVHGVFAEEFLRLIEEVRESMDSERADAVLLLLGLMQGKALNYNSKLASWIAPRQVIRSVFERHDLSFKWTFSEFEGATALYQWSLSQILKVYPQICALLERTASDPTTGAVLPRSVTVTRANAADLHAIEDGTVAHVCIDPPYYDNVMYAELADYFYVWEKRTIGMIRPQFFEAALSDKQNEAVANPSRFSGTARRKSELADVDYESKMTAIFSEARRVLRDDGVLSVMFTHKRAEAWDTLGAGLLQAGFTIQTSWPVNTEAEHSLHQKNVNSAASTIMLVCRKRLVDAGSARVFLDDIEADVRAAARDASVRFQDAGIDGVDLLLAAYGPALSVISKRWPVYSSSPDEAGRERLLRPEEALAIAREEVVRLRRNRLVGRAAQIDDLTDFTLLAWDVFGAREFPFDTARLLALAVGGLDVDDLARAKIIEKKAGSVRILEPRERVRRVGDEEPGVYVDASRFGSQIDAVHTVLHVAGVDGMYAAKAVMDRGGLTEDDAFLATIQGLVNAIPRAKHKGEWVNPEAGLLETLATAYLPGVMIPVAKETPEVAQASLFDSE